MASTLASASGAAMVGFQQVGAGSTARTVQDKLRDTVSTADKGLVSGAAADALILAALSEHDVVNVQPGSYTLTNTTKTGATNKTLKGEPGKSVFTAPVASALNMLSFFDASNVRVSGITLNQARSSIAQAGSGLVFRDANNVTVDNVRVEGLGGLGNGILQYNSETAPGSGVYAKTERVVYRNIDVIGNRAISDNVNGAIIVDAYWSRLHGIYAQGIGDFPAEFKNDCRYGLLSDVQIRDSRTGLYHGSTSEGNHPSFTASSNVVIKGADFGVVTGFGTNNSYSNILNDSDGTSYINPEAARIDGSANSIWSLHSTGSANTYGVRYNPTASNNYAKISAQHTYPVVVTAKTGSARNVTEIAHPGARNSLFTGSVYVNEAGVYSGPTANPVYCHGTGQYVGTLSGTWEWRIGKPAESSPFSTDVWRYTSAGQSAFLCMVGDDGYQHGLTIQTPSGYKYATYNDANDSWELKGKVIAYRFGPTAFSPRADNVAGLGAGSLRWSTIYAGTGAINTSDEREKQDIAAIDAAAIRAVRKVSFKQFRFRDAVAKKGSAARVHFGVIAQEVKAAFESEGVDPFKYGVLCYDEWTAIDDDPAGSRFGIRYDELLCLKLAAMDLP
jgi:hypothetical protein